MDNLEKRDLVANIMRTLEISFVLSNMHKQVHLHNSTDKLNMSLLRIDS